MAWQITIETLPYDTRCWKCFLFLFYWEDVRVWRWLISFLLERRRKRIEVQSAHWREYEWNLLGLNILRSLGGMVLNESVLCLWERMPSCDQKLYGDPRNTCITTGSFPACAVMWVSYNCDLLGYSQYLGNLWSKSLIYTHHWRSKAENSTEPLCTRGSLYQQCLCHLLSRPFCLNHSLYPSIQHESLKLVE
jgi:hypothetical protein